MFSMQDYKLVTIPLLVDTKLNLHTCPKCEDEFDYMSINVSYYSVIVSLIYVMIYIDPNISQVVGALSRFMFNPSREHEIMWRG